MGSKSMPVSPATHPLPSSGVPALFKQVAGGSVERASDLPCNLVQGTCADLSTLGFSAPKPKSLFLATSAWALLSPRCLAPTDRYRIYVFSGLAPAEIIPFLNNRGSKDAHFSFCGFYCVSSVNELKGLSLNMLGAKLASVPLTYKMTIALKTPTGNSERSLGSPEVIRNGLATGPIPWPMT